MKKFAEIAYPIVYLVATIGGAIYGMVAHESYGMGLAICGIIGGGLGLIAATLLILVFALIVNLFFVHKTFQPKK
jgi:uncharacterized membrane protein